MTENVIQLMAKITLRIIIMIVTTIMIRVMVIISNHSNYNDY